MRMQRRRLLVSSTQGDSLELDYFQQPLIVDASGQVVRQCEWARDEQGGWYSFDPDQHEVTESRSGLCFRIRRWLG